ncbi:aspartyl-phosphate phosphatase Spo0E family protein [Clostridium polynesiense]|uniref:aspartyl-phosphate phosphatase Spo0E family protein n=1 Tax=Clostridium polynesiense TaxID=1325933 RepID=UPI0005908918|nr:aspartyl-phosphate phosphatase Spo0E family protein [Clostridium polynesiense]
MNINFLKFKIKTVRKLMYLLLEFLKPSNKYVVVCSQILDKLIVEYQMLSISINHKKYVHQRIISKKYKIKRLRRVS